MTFFVIEGQKKWNNLILNKFPSSNDIYYDYNYFNIFKRGYDVDFEAVYWEDENICIFWPHLIRDISSLTLYSNYYVKDLITPNGYGGPLINFKTKHKGKGTLFDALMIRFRVTSAKNPRSYNKGIPAMGNPRSPTRFKAIRQSSRFPEDV